MSEIILFTELAMISTSILGRNFSKISKFPINELWKELLNALYIMFKWISSPRDMNKSLVLCVINYTVGCSNFRTTCVFTCLSKYLQMKQKSKYYRLWSFIHNFRWWIILLPFPVGLGSYALFCLLCWKVIMGVQAPNPSSIKFIF